MKPIPISDFKLGSSIQGFYFCKEKCLRYTRNGDIFLDIIFSDSTGSISGKMWDLVEDFQDRFKKGDPVAVKGRVTEFKGQTQLTVSQINKATKSQYGKYGFSIDILIKKITDSIDELWISIFNIIKELDKPYSQIIRKIYKENEKKIKIIPMSTEDEIIQGSFLKNLVVTAKISLAILPYYPGLNKNLVLCGVLLQNIGRIKSINDVIYSGPTDEGLLLGYKTLGLEILQKSATSVKDIPKGMLLKLEHMILYSISDEINSQEVPQFPEALFIKYISNLDWKINHILIGVQNDSKK